ncbi:DUF3040 domain-containing protein [Sphaerisporangium aureirubrum]|uniref:DUF3040 domain-containing protein n=1 Tax=Sphaerisporangium aureirubrum TaxID=1544736 RepID=A0ABW1NRU1_9ACTN
MPWSQDEERMLAQIERYLSDDDPRLAARLESFNERAGREVTGRRKRAPRPPKAPKARRRMGRSTVIILVSWLLIATLITTLLIMVFRHDAAALPL